MSRLRAKPNGSPSQAGSENRFSIRKYSTSTNEITLCGSGQEADGICLAETMTGEILNFEGTNYARKTTGQYDGVTIAAAFQCGDELMSGENGVITPYVAAGDNRPLGKFLTSGSSGETGRIVIYGR